MFETYDLKNSYPQEFRLFCFLPKLIMSAGSTVVPVSFCWGKEGSTPFALVRASMEVVCVTGLLFRAKHPGGVCTHFEPFPGVVTQALGCQYC
mmetsp:Transcript_13172/g.13333  ORF Transcript_13172/g.13333 Transcript_13172/m.13333 type:complete len:93 (-) Transcript_13172:136-414(-)